MRMTVILTLLVILCANAAPAAEGEKRNTAPNCPPSAAENTQRDPVEMKEPSPPPMTADKPRAPDFPRLEGEITAAKALRSIYGNYDSETNTAGWFADLPEMRVIMHITKRDQRELHSKPTVFPVVPLSELRVLPPGRERFLLLTSPTWPYGFGCHACAPPVGAAIFEPTPRGWRLSWSRKIIDYVGEEGDPVGVTESVHIGPDKMGFVLHPFFSSAGFGEGGLVVIGEVENELKEVLDLWRTKADNEGDCSPDDRVHQCYRYDTALTFTPGENAEYFDILRTTSGTYSSNTRCRPIEQVKSSARYVFRDGRYQPAP